MLLSRAATMRLHRPDRIPTKRKTRAYVPRSAASLCLSIALVISASERLPADDSHRETDSLRSFAPHSRAEQSRLEQALLEIPSADSLKAVHDLVSSRPHVAGSAGDAHVIDNLVASYERLGLEVEKHEFWAYLSEPVSASLEIVSPDPMALGLREDPVAGDPYVGHSETDFGWNAYSASGDVTAEVVFANHGTREDFERLESLGVDVTGRIVVARYGGNFRGHKVRFAERAGAAGVILYTDPEDAGYARGLMYPEGGWANESYIQRGSVLVLPYSGDPLTPFRPATEDADRLAPADVSLPTIPVQPIGWGAAREILSRMKGTVVPEEWQGALPFNYRLTGGSELVVRMQVEQHRRLTKTSNVIGRFRGSELPNELVVVGSHHDAWSFGAGDPNAGTIVVYEAARTFAELVRRGLRPKRTLVFANWGAEEFGIIGSVEWVEMHREELAAGAVAYINLDGAAMGRDFGASAAPLLKGLVLDAAGMVPAPAGQGSVLAQWTERTAASGGEPHIGNLGGGSDHVGFYCYLGVPSAGLSGAGSPGVSYHSNYENLAWYRQIVGTDYEPALMLTRVVNVMLSRLANADLLPFSFERYGDDLATHAEELAQRVSDDDAVTLRKLAERGRDWSKQAARLRQLMLSGLESGDLSAASLSRLNLELLRLERTWLAPDGLPGRPWSRNLFAATDEDSGYAAWMLPAIRWAIERQQPVARQARQYDLVLDELERRLGILDRALTTSTGDNG